MQRVPGLRYYPDSRPGISRRRSGRGFSYLAPDGTAIADPDERARLAALAVPPAYERVWICPFPNGHLLATGYDSRERKQYRYHPDWSAYRSQGKFDRLAQFGRALPAIRRRVARDLKGEAGELDFALAAIVAMLDRLALRIGNADAAKENGSFGATTLRTRHLRMAETGARLRFIAKGGKRVDAALDDQRLNRMLQKMDDLPGGVLIRWLDDDGKPQPVASEQVNAYLAEISGEAGATAKSFRTWNGTLAAFTLALRDDPGLTIAAMSEAAAEALHNTPAISRKSYIHPDVIALAERDPETRAAALAALEPEPIAGLRRDEARLLAFLER
jgi:DNA topoisomerase-1